jgi:hypothetical protein
MSIENLKTFDPFAEADEGGEQVTQKNQQDYIHIRIQRTYPSHGKQSYAHCCQQHPYDPHPPLQRAPFKHLPYYSAFGRTLT